MPLMNGVVEPVGRVRAGVRRLRAGPGTGLAACRPGARSRWTAGGGPGVTHAVARLRALHQEGSAAGHEQDDGGEQHVRQGRQLPGEGARPGFQPSLNTMFSTLYRLDSRAAPV